jgi:O-antigen/teichoic acid export membrane protein
MKRGTFYLVLAWSVQVVAGYGLNIWLGRTLGVAHYGTYGVVMSILLWIEIGAINGLPMAIQKFVSAGESMARAILIRSIQIQMVFVGLLFLASFAAAPWIGGLLRDDSVGFYLKVAVWDVWVYGFFFMLASLQNGLRRFGRQALMVGFYAVCKLGLVILLVSLTGNVREAFLANIGASVAGLVMGLIFLRQARLQRESGKFEGRILIRYAAPVAVYSLVINLLQNVDLWFVKYYLEKIDSGYYVAASTIARVPYYIFFGLSATVLPLLSKAIAGNDENRIRKTVKTAVRFLVILAAPVCVLAMAYSHQVVTLLYSTSYDPAGDVLGILIWGMAFLALFSLLTTMINADNRPVAALGVTAVILVLDVVLNRLLLPRLELRGAALATTLSLLAGSVLAALMVIRRFRAFVATRTVARVALASGSVYGLARLIPADGVMVIPVGAGLFIIYGLFLMLLGEIRREELIR